MAQGLGKTPKKNKSAASSAKLSKRKLAKGRMTFATKGRNKVALARQNVATSRAICKKNEKIISAKAITAGNTFFLNDIKEQGKKEKLRFKRNQTREEKKGVNDLGRRLKDQLKKLGKETNN
mmetsp:Transcript_27648/g.32721  ORF Transcript_27648/g.32721 Transcript_27648/m.32721 type:complete len:122 (+) Transcript_27648:205-570(+)|eukprot:CAMPEP_0198249490 /NCGR_PEP_ID=MMETSP1447-20131203/1012_1 /TAXON_ID=420782 /ORGANISM="Chaetoceros dichaeta, Strain CCMP1751" /LENGTH=121 /DNA_ID=CAMNT_0043934145 /DNA_START=138 /DNA_END=503 /DNA_ORIENTATION=+